LKILDLTEFYSERGGVRNQLDQKGRILRRLGHHHVIVAPGVEDGISDLPPPPGEGNGHSKESGTARVFRVGGPTLPYDANYQLLWRLDKVGRIIRQEKPDVFQINSPYLAALSQRGVGTESVGIKTFWWHADFIDTYAVERLRPFWGPVRSEAIVRPLWAMVRAIAAGCEATLAASQHQVDKLVAHGAPRVRLVPFGIDKQLFTPEARSEAWRAGVFPQPSNGPTWVAMGRLSVEKHWPVVLEGFARFRRRREARLVILGDGPERAALEQGFGGRGDVKFMGFERDPKKIATALASSDAFVHGCPFETFGLSVAQAIACGVPVVVPDQGGAAELARPSFAETYPAGSIEGCADALERLCRRDPASLREGAIGGRASIFDAVEQVKHTVEVYSELLSRRAHDHDPRTFGKDVAS